MASFRWFGSNVRAEGSLKFALSGPVAAGAGDGVAGAFEVVLDAGAGAGAAGTAGVGAGAGVGVDGAFAVDAEAAVAPLGYTDCQSLATRRFFAEVYYSRSHAYDKPLFLDVV